MMSYFIQAEINTLDTIYMKCSQVLQPIIQFNIIQHISTKMNLLKIDQQINDFKQRIVKTLKLQQSENCSKQKKLCNWISQQSSKLKKPKDQMNSSYHKFVTGIMQKIIKVQQQPKDIQNDLKHLLQCVKKRFIPKNFTFESKNIPADIVAAVNELKQKKWDNYYGQVRGPFLSNMFIMKKQDFHSSVQQVKVNGLKLMMIQEKVAHRYQKNLIQQIFGRIFRSKGSLSSVIRVQVNHDPLQTSYNLFCYIEDRKLVDEDKVFKSLSQLQQNGSKLQLLNNGKFIQVNQLNLLQIFLSQILVVPVQSLVSEFVMQIITSKDNNNKDQLQIEIVKCNQQDQKQIVQQSSLRQHASLRNPLLYFSNYLREHPIKISQAQKVAVNKQLYACFYRCLQIIIKLCLTDFDTSTQQVKINSSICFNLQVFTAMWNIFHKISLLSGWMEQVIQPIKNTITISQIISHFCPIFNEISMSYSNAQNFVLYRDFYKNVEMESYLGSVISKKTLQKYKDVFINQYQAVINKKYTNAPQIYNQIFKPILKQVNIQYIDPIQASYILYFSSKFRYQYHPLSTDVDQKWKEPKLWEKCVKSLSKQEANESGEAYFIDIGFDILGYVCGVNIYELDHHCFQRIKHFQETQSSLLGVSWFCDFIHQKYQKQSSLILSSLLENALKHKKFMTCKKLLQKRIRIRDFHQIIGFHELVNQIDQQTREALIKTIQEDSPQMHRLFKWQQLMLVHLQKQSKQSVPVQTLDFGVIHIPKQVFETNLKKGKLLNNLSRKDYKFNSVREIAKITLKTNNGKNVSYYLQISQYPLMPYFFRAFFKQVGTPEIMPYFTSFFYQNKLFHLIQCLDQSMNYRKGLTTFKQEELNALTDENLIAQAILLSMVIIPAQITTSDMIICPSKATHDQIFIVDWHTSFCKNFMHRYMGKVNLNSQNCLFLMDRMSKTLEIKIINKYANVQIQQICQDVLAQCQHINKKVTILKQKYRKEEQDILKNQMLAIMFEEGFIFDVAERMYKIKRVFSKKEGNIQKGLSFYKLLEILSSQTSYYYQQIFNSNQCIISREKILFDENYKRPFLQNTLVQFFGSFLKLQQVDNVFPSHYQRFCFQGPTQNLVDAATNMKKFVSFNRSQIPQNLYEYTKQDFQYYMRNCDLSGLDTTKKQKLVEIIKNKSKQYLSSQQRRVLPLSYVCIKSMQFIKDRSLANSFSFERLQQLGIQSCKLGDYQLNSFPKTIENISYLYLRDISGLKYIGQNTLYGKVIEIKHLRTLSIIQCNDLVSIDLKCDILQNLQSRNNRSLTTINIYSLNLKNICIYNNPSLNFQNIGVYIIKGINVLVCKSSCGGDLMKLYSQDYQTYIAYAMRYLLIRFYQSSDSRYNVLLTLLKMKQVDQNLFALSGFSNVKAISTVFNKYTTDVQDKILSQLLRLYIENPYRKKVAIGNLTQSITITNNLSPQRVMKCLNQALLKVRDSLKLINEIKFETTKNFFTNINSAHVKVLVERLKLDKNLTLILQNLNDEIQNQDGENKAIVNKQIDTIRYLALQRDQLQKMTLIFRKSTVKLTFLDRIFQGTESLEQIMKQQQEFSPNMSKRSKSGLSYRQSLIQQNQKYMKIVNLNIQGCTIKNDRPVDLKQIQSQLKQAEEKSKVIQQQNQIQFQDICKTSINYSSVKNLKLQNCVVNSFDIMECMKNLTTLSIYKCQLSANKKKIGLSIKSQISQISTVKQQAETKNNIKQMVPLYKRFFKFLSKRQLHTLDLQNFFTTSIDKQDYNKIFDRFCELLKKMKKLQILKLNKNYFTLQSLQKLDKIINQTDIQQLQLNGLILPLTGSSIISGQKQQQQSQKQLCKGFSKLFSQTTNLKSLTIQLNHHDAIENFLKSISKNTSIIQLKLNTNCQISSDVLKHLNKNKILSFISSNMQLPVWLLNHVNQNGKNMRKSFIKQDAQKDNKYRLEESMSLGSMNNIRNNDYFRIGLSLDGGGVRGMLLATQLNYLATRVGYPLHKIFDCIGGTSIGGILALASTGTLDGYNPVANTQELMALFSKYGRDIFKKTQIMQFKNLFDTKYSASSFEGVLKNYFKDCKLSDCLPQTNVIVTAVNRVDNKDYIFKSMEALLNRDKDFYMRDAGRATSAAPTYFPSAQIKNINASMKLSLVDGGVGLNNPSKLVIDQVKKIATNSGTPDNYFLLSLGTGKLPSEVIPQYAGLKDLSPIIDSFTQSAAYFVQRDLASNYKGHYFRVSPLINVAVKKDAELDNTSEEIIEMYRQTGLQAAKKYFQNTVIFGKYRNMNIIQWLRENTVKKYEY